MNPYLSVIIPTFSRWEKLAKCLEALKKQTLSQDAFEVLLIDDGSRDETWDFLNEELQNWSNLRIFHQKNAGQSTARNHGINEAQGQIVLFLGDDIYAAPSLLETHSKFHQRCPEEREACLGRVEWDTNSELTPFMEWLTHGGPQFAYHKLKEGEAATFWFFYTSNLSMKRSLLQRERFDQDFKGYGWEDIELGYRLQKNEGLKLIYQKEALAFHEHKSDEASLKVRMLNVGSQSLNKQKKHPELALVPTGLRRILLKSVSSNLFLFFFWLVKPLTPKPYWFLLSKHYFLRGQRKV